MSKKKDKKELALEKKGSIMKPPEHHEPNFHDYISEEQIYALPVVTDAVDYIM